MQDISSGKAFFKYMYRPLSLPRLWSSCSAKNKFAKHVETHSSSGNGDILKIKSKNIRKKVEKNLSVSVDNLKSVNVVPVNVRRNAPKRTSCELCGKSITVKNMKRHMERKHGKKSCYTAVCGDRSIGLYMDRRSQHGGVGFPFHVQKVVNSSKDGNKNVCELQSCKDEMEIASRSGMKGRECQHLSLVNNAFYPPDVQLDISRLNELSASGMFKVLKNETIQRCIAHKDLAENDCPAPEVE